MARAAALELEMEIIDLSRELSVDTQVHPSQPQTKIDVTHDHSQKVTFGKTTYSHRTLCITLSDHASTHVDAPVHFDPRPNALSVDQIPLENFYTSAICLDLSHIPLKHAISVAELETARSKAGLQILPKDTVLIYMNTNGRLAGRPEYLTDFPGLSPEAVHWLADFDIHQFGVEAISPAPAGELNLLAHKACAQRGITHIECMDNLDKLIGRGRFRFIGFPLKIKGGTASPIRAVAIFD